MKIKVINGITYTHRTRAGLPARIICTDRAHNENKIIGLVLEGITEEAYFFTEDLKLPGGDYNYDLLEGVKPEPDWSKVEVDTKVFTRDHDQDIWRPRHFAELIGEHLYAWKEGATSFSAENQKVHWRQMKLAED